VPGDLALDFDPLHTLGFLISDWVEAHCLVPGGVFEGEPLVFSGGQLFWMANHYRVRPGAVVDQRRLVAPFWFRRSVIVGPQKSGKSPWGAAWALAEGVGPSLFAGFAQGGEVFRCADHGCGCGWEYEFLPGEAMGVPRRKSLVGLLAFAESQTANVYEPLQTMIHSGPLADVARVREGFIRLPNRGMIVPLTSKMRSKLGQPLTAALADESGLYTRANRVAGTWETLRRNVAGMQGRTVELTNPWDPMEASSAQMAFESRQTDIFRYYRKPPANLSYRNRRERHKIHTIVYADAPWVDVAAIDAEAAELVEKDPAQAERFYGNRLVQGLGAFLTEALVDGATVDGTPGGDVALGFDGSLSGDWTAIRAEDSAGLRFTPTYTVGGEERPAFWDPAEWGGRIPRGEVHVAVEQLMGRFRVRRMYCDPREWETEIDGWSLTYGEDRVIKWPTNQIGRVHPALVRFQVDMGERTTTHCPDATFKLHALAARKIAKPGDKFILGKPSENQKIDLLMADVLAHEAACDARAEGWGQTDSRVWCMGFDDDEYIDEGIRTEFRRR